MKTKYPLFIIFLLFFILCSFTIFAKQTIEENGFRIEAKDNYYCEPIYRGDECLIIADFLIVNTQNSNKDIYIDTSYTTKVKVDGYKDKKDKTYYKTDKDKTKTKDKVKIDKYSNKTFTVYLWTENSGKFNITVDDNNILTILDPYYNITTNASAPSYHLINGTVNTYPDYDFTQQNEISSGLSDSSDITTYETNRFTTSLNNKNFVFWEVDGNNWDNRTSAVTTINDGQNEEINHDLGADKYANLTLTDNTRFYNGDTINFYAQPNDIDKYIHITSKNTSNILAVFYVGSSKVYQWYNVTLTNISEYGVKTLLIHDGTQSGALKLKHDYITLTSSNNIGKAISVFFNYTMNSSNDYWLRTRKTTSGLANMTIFTYINSTHINTSNYKNYVITTDWDVIPINDIIYDGYSLPFRIYSQEPFSFSEVQLVEQIEDNVTPNVNYCGVSTTSLGCGDTIQFYCNITDNHDLDKVYFRITDKTSTYQEADRIINSDIFWWNKTYNYFTNITESYSFDYVNVTDFVGNNNLTYLNIDYNYTCLSCVEDWIENPYSCLTNDSYFKTYYDNNSCGTTDNLPVDNGTWQYCDYCTPIPTNTSCLDNTTNYFILEYDYLNCFSLTNLSSDNFTNITYACYPLLNELVVSYYTAFPEIAGKNDGITWLVKIPSEYFTGKEFSCLSYVKKNNQTIQTNPKLESQGIRGKEDRTAFTTINGQTSVYFTGENLKIDGIQEYVFGVKCSDGNNTKVSEYYVKPQLENLDFVGSSYLWGMTNSSSVLAIILLSIIILGILFWLWKWSRL